MRHPRLLSALGAFAILMATAQAAEMTTADRAARCENNRSRIAQLEQQLAGDPDYVTTEQIARLRAALVSVGRIHRQAQEWNEKIQGLFDKGVWGTHAYTVYRAISSAARLANLQGSQCNILKRYNGDDVITAGPLAACVNALKPALAGRIDRGKIALARHNELEAELARHRARLSELQCNGPQTDRLDRDWPPIAGVWYREGDRARPTSIGQSGKQLTFTNEFKPPMTSKGHFVTTRSMVADDWEGGLSATLSADGNRIDWGNGTSWSR